MTHSFYKQRITEEKDFKVFIVSYIIDYCADTIRYAGNEGEEFLDEDVITNCCDTFLSYVVGPHCFIKNNLIKVPANHIAYTRLFSMLDLYNYIGNGLSKYLTTNSLREVCLNIEKMVVFGDLYKPCEMDIGTIYKYNCWAIELLRNFKDYLGSYVVS